jgi:hypothetical protein
MKSRLFWKILTIIMAIGLLRLLTYVSVSGEAKNSQSILQLEGRIFPVKSVAWSPDGQKNCNRFY